LKKWSKGYPVLSGNAISDAPTNSGFVAKVYHGTTNGFNIFDPEVKGTKEGQFGQVNYFTSVQGDAEINYAGEGPDLTNRIEQRTEQLVQEIYDNGFEEIQYAYNLPDKFTEDTDPEEIARHIAKEELHGGNPTTKHLYVRVDNPVFVGGDKNTWIQNTDTEQYREDATAEVLEENDADPSEAEEYEDEIQDRIFEMADTDEPKIFKAIQDALSEFEHDADPVQVYQELELYDDEISGTELEERLRASETLMYVEDYEEGGLLQSHIIGQVFKNLGFDGIVLQNADQRFKNMDMGGETTHIHVFAETPSQIKSFVFPMLPPVLADYCVRVTFISSWG